MGINILRAVPFPLLRSRLVEQLAFAISSVYTLNLCICRLIYKFQDNVMQKLVGFSLRKGLVFLFLVLFWVSTSANAEEKGGDGGYIMMEEFTVNLVGLHQVIQVKLTLKPAKTPLAADKIRLYVPAIRHEIILLLSAKTPEQLQTQEGKKKLITETRDAANKALGMNSKEGVKEGVVEVLVESIIIQ